MQDNSPQAPVSLLTRRFIAEYPREAAMIIPSLNVEALVKLLEQQSIAVSKRLWRFLAPQTKFNLVVRMSTRYAGDLFSSIDISDAAFLISRCPPPRATEIMENMRGGARTEVARILNYPDNSAGRVMSTLFPCVHPHQTLSDIRNILAEHEFEDVMNVFVVDEDNQYVGRIDLQSAIRMEPDSQVQSFMRTTGVAVQVTSPIDDAIPLVRSGREVEIPVVDARHRLVGVLRGEEILRTVETDAASDLQAMVGVSRDEKALSNPWFSIRKRLPWMQINLATAFLAASVVGLFENTIAQFTALAVLLPVVAGQSGNAGAQALAVTMRGLALREISTQQWLRIVFKEVTVGLINGLAIALTTAVGVYIWSRSLGLALVISIAMVVSMIAAGIAGAAVPMVLTRLGQDPAQSSSIILTTVTDVAGFLSFLGIATLLSFLL